jgi:uncharacterized membrane protein (UPF0127 family)
MTRARVQLLIMVLYLTFGATTILMPGILLDVLGASSEDRTPVALLMTRAFGAVCVGLAIGLVGAAGMIRLIQRFSLPSEGLYPLRTLAAALTIYGVATVLHGSGFLAVFIAGIAIGDLDVPYQAEIRRFHIALSSLAEIVMFVALGLTAYVVEQLEERRQAPDLRTDALVIPPLHPRVDALPLGVVALHPETADEPVQVRVRIAATPEERRHGLMEVEHLPDGVGMLFVYDADTTSGFWMKDTLVPLDIAWASAEGEIVAVATMEPCAGDPCPTYSPGHPYRYALEVPAGFLERAGVTVGDRLERVYP